MLQQLGNPVLLDINDPNSSTPLQIQMPWFSTIEMNVPLQEEVPWLSPIWPVGEASSGVIKGAASPPCVFMGSQQWFTEQVILSPLSLPELTNISHSSSSYLLVREPLLFSQWVTNESTDIDGLCGWMLPPMLNCRYCNYESYPASFRDYEKRKLSHIVLILPEVCLIWIVCNMTFWYSPWVS